MTDAASNSELNVGTDNTLVGCDPKAFRAAMRKVPGAVAIITSNTDSARNGLTATAVCSVSAEPPQLLICVNLSASVKPIISDAGRFAVNFAARDQERVAKLFATSKLDPNERFGSADWETLQTGAPVLKGASTVFDCKLVSESTHGTHAIFVGEVMATGGSGGEPLVYHDAGFTSISAPQLSL